MSFKKSGMVFKKREEYSYKNTTIALDIVDEIGEFVEIEVISDDKDSALLAIESVKTEIGITGVNIRKSYLEMVLDKK